MTTSSKTFLKGFIVLCAAAFVFNAEAGGAKKATVKNPIKVTGKTADGRYNTYDLDGELDDLNYSSITGNIIYQPDDLPDRIPFISPKDTNKGVYVCEFVCKDAHGNIVGLNPQWAKLYGKSVPK